MAEPELPPPPTVHVATTVGPWHRRVARVILWLLRFRAEGVPPSGGGYVMIAAPHTTNWDLPLMLAVGWDLGVRMCWLGKHTLFWWPLGSLLRALGGIAVDRQRAGGIVPQVAALYATNPGLVVSVPPEGTRRKGQYWKSGFYRIARAAGVPIAFGYLDYARRAGGIGPTLLQPTGDLQKDAEPIRAFYQDIKGKYPQNFTNATFRADEPAEG